MSKLHLMFELGRLQVPVMNLDDDQIADELRDVALPKIDKPRAGIASEN